MRKRSNFNIDDWRSVLLAAIIIFFGTISGCSADSHLKKAAKHTRKAAQKGAIISVDVDTVTLNDTTTIVEVRNDTVFITKTVVEKVTITSDPEIRYITKRDKRLERKHQDRVRRDSLKIVRLELKYQDDLNRLQARLNKRQAVKVEKQKTKQVKAKNRPRLRWMWYIPLIVVLLLVARWVYYTFIYRI